jgi:hypothetical protein
MSTLGAAKVACIGETCSGVGVGVVGDDNDDAEEITIVLIRVRKEAMLIVSM